IVIPQSVTYIGGTLFGACDALTSITVEEGNTVYHSNGNCIIETATKTLISGCNNSTIPTDGSVEIIGSSTFHYCDVFENIVIPSVITKIGSYAYNSCDNLTSVIIEQGVAIIDRKAFANCQSLVSVIIPDSVTSIGEYAFEGCSSLTNIYYTGTEEEWTKLVISDNPYLANATIIYNYVPEE
ncbi:MAG: leucine-rich repeat domain-containing protein, partial [Clostridia bacterium]|nr:leucine-rich repeat domain-containing protein [Clostridia bacterium]